MKDKPWSRSTARRVNCRYIVHRVGNLLWLRGGFDKQVAIDSGFVYSPKYRAYWIKQEDRNSSLPAFLVRENTVSRSDTVSELESWLRREYGGKVAPILIRSGGGIADEYKRIPPRFRTSRTNSNAVAFDLVAQAAFEAGLIRNPFESDLLDALESLGTKIPVSNSIETETYETGRCYKVKQKSKVPLNEVPF